MADAEVLFDPPTMPVFNHLDHHLWPRVLDTDGQHINVLAWNRARAEGSFVGSCRACGGYLRPLPTDSPPHAGDDLSSITEWLGCECIRCGHEFVAPDGKVLKRSAMHSQMPREYLRTKAGNIAKPRTDGT